MNSNINSDTPPLALTMGDPAGIGLEIALKAWYARTAENIPPFCLLAPSHLLSERSDRIGLKTPVKVISNLNNVAETFQTALPIYEIPVKVTIEPGKPDPSYADSVTSSIEKAVELVQQNLCSAIVTNPIAKSVLYQAGFKYPGHTEYLGELGQHYYNVPPAPVMMLASEELRTVPTTIHIPLEQVPQALTYDLLLKTIQITYQDLKRYFNITNPHIAVTGLNPHAGENGSLGTEEIETIIPVIKQLQSKGLNITGPYPADTIFHKTARESYDAVVAMYHDQALIPLKTLSFDEGVNVTLGLPFIRTSPDHGTAFDIAGTGKANPRSLIEALKLGDQMYQNKRRTNNND